MAQKTFITHIVHEVAHVEAVLQRVGRAEKFAKRKQVVD